MDSTGGIVFKPIIEIEDLAGIDAGKITVKEMKRRLDRMRSEDCY